MYHPPVILQNIFFPESGHFSPGQLSPGKVSPIKFLPGKLPPGLLSPGQLPQNNSHWITNPRNIVPL